MVVEIIRADITDEEREKILKEFKKILANMIKDINTQALVHTIK